MNKVISTLSLALACFFTTGVVAQAIDATYTESGGVYTFTGSGGIPSTPSLGGNPDVAGVVVNEGVVLSASVSNSVLAVFGGVTLNSGSSIQNLGMFAVDGDEGASLTVDGLGANITNADNIIFEGGVLSITGSLNLNAENMVFSASTGGSDSTINLNLASVASTDTAMLNLTVSARGSLEFSDTVINLTGSAFSGNYALLSVADANTSKIEAGGVFMLNGASLSIGNELSWSTVDGISTLIYSAAVPEPSTFGLLAGLGALAFVVSRRRRFSKK